MWSEGTEHVAQGLREQLRFGCGREVTAVVVFVPFGDMEEALGELARRLGERHPLAAEDGHRAVTSVKGVEGVRDLRIRWIGHTLRAEVDLTVPADLNITQAHDLAHHAEAHLLDQVGRLTAATVHASPACAH